jgi:peptidoglycan biosynthesis protein MviN/MurJ (putative lipid II flippase)
MIVKIGLGLSGDMLLAMMAAPQLLIAIVGNSFQNVLLPIYKKRNICKTNIELANLCVEVTVFFAIIASLVSLMAGAYIYNAHKEKIEIIEFIAANIILVVWGVLTILQSIISTRFLIDEKFDALEKINLYANITSIGVLMMPSGGMNELVVSVALLAKGIVATKLIYKYYPMKVNFIFKSNNKNKIIYRKIKNLIISASYMKSEILVDRFVLAKNGAGELAIFYTVQQVNSLIQQMFNRAITNPYFVKITKSVNINKKISTDMQRQMVNRLVLSIAIGVVLVSAVAIFGDAIIEEGRKIINFNQEKLLIIKNVLMASIGVLVGSLLSQILVSSYYAVGDFKTPMAISILTYTISIPVKIISYQNFGVIGLALVSSIYYMTDSVVQFILLKKFST